MSRNQLILFTGGALALVLLLGRKKKTTTETRVTRRIEDPPILGSGAQQNGAPAPAPAPPQNIPANGQSVKVASGVTPIPQSPYVPPPGRDTAEGRGRIEAIKQDLAKRNGERVAVPQRDASGRVVRTKTPIECSALLDAGRIEDAEKFGCFQELYTAYLSLVEMGLEELRQTNEKLQSKVHKDTGIAMSKGFLQGLEEKKARLIAEIQRNRRMMRYFEEKME